MILIIDNYDSFTYNLAQYLGEMGQQLKIFRNDRVSLEQIEEMRPDRILISPGPGKPEEAGISVELVRCFAGKVPILGVCLGHQAIAKAFGGEIVPARRLMHGKTSMVEHDGEGVYRGLANPFEATRYHSLIVRRETLPDCLRVTAETDAREIMGVRHREHPVEGVQFHPESILTAEGKKLMHNFVGDSTG